MILQFLGYLLFDTCAVSLIFFILIFVYIWTDTVPDVPMMSSSKAIEDFDHLIPPIYVNDHILKCEVNIDDKNYLNIPLNDKVYEINGDVFREDVLEDKETIANFEIKIMDSEMELTTLVPEDTFMSISTQVSSYGIIINSNILLPVNNWNSLIDQKNKTKCVICDQVIDNVEEHLKSHVHERNMDRHQPLKKFDLSIVRLIGDKYHCGVCNKIFDTTHADDHLDSKNHEDKILFATNRASDVMFDFSMLYDNPTANSGNKNNDWYHFNRNKINSMSNTSGFDSVSPDGFYDYDLNAHNENDAWISDNDNVEPIANNDFSYASIAKNTAATPEYLDIIVYDNKKVKFKFDTWHMIVTLKPNQMFCMVCNEFHHITQKAKHCSENQHIFSLGRCHFVETYKDYFVRRVDNKHYHCGLCNNLQVKYEMDDHIELMHAKKPKPALQDNLTPKRNRNNENVLKISATRNNKIQATPDASTKRKDKQKTVTTETNNDMNEQKINSVDAQTNNARKIGHDNETFISTIPKPPEATNNKLLGVKNHITINIFGYNLRVLFISYNIVYKRIYDYYCGICFFASTEVIMNQHMNENSHLEILKQTPFQNKYGVNLVRNIGHNSHCTICNMFLNVSLIDTHIKTLAHITLLNEALRTDQITPDETSKNEVNEIKNLKQTPKIEANMQKPTTIMSDKELDVPDKENEKQKKINIPDKKIKDIKDKEQDILLIDMEDKKNCSSKMELDDCHDLNDAMESQEADVEDNQCINEFVYLKTKTTFIKVSCVSYNTLIYIGDGTRYCFVCSKQVFSSLKRHINSQTHETSIQNCKFLIEYDKHFLRQMLILYHCAICNVIFSKKDLNKHINWQMHLKDNKIDKKARKKDVKSGMKQISISSQNEAEFPNEVEPEMEILKIEMKHNSQFESVQKKNKIVIYQDKVFKISWDAWHSLCKDKVGYKCLLCQQSVKNYELSSHVNDGHHKYILDIFERQYLPALIRKVNESILHCVTCNTEITSRKHVITEHINGKKHKKNDEQLRDSVTNHADFKDDALHLQ